MNLDPDLPETGRLAWLARRLNRINQALRSLQPVQGPDILTGHSALGVTRRPKAKATDTQVPPGTDQPLWL
jgi:hypothetical protein